MIALAALIALAPESFPLWAGDAPGAKGKAATDIPTLTLFKPAHPCGSAVVVCPGGGYGMLADHEGSAYAMFLNRLGVTAFVLKYRLGSSGYRFPVELQDVQRAIRTVRFRSKEWKIDPKKIGVMGSSAGGHLASMAVTQPFVGDGSSKDPIDRQSARPDFGILCYAVISMGPKGHGGSLHALLGDNPAPALVEQTSSEKQVSANTPPCFIWHTADDPVVPVANSELFASALQKFEIPYELHIYPHGAHGLGLGGPPNSDTLLPWTLELTRWMIKRKWAHAIEPLTL